MAVVTSIKVVQPGSAPDIDTDFSTRVRDDILQHCRDLYGEGSVSNIGTYSRLGLKSAFKRLCTIYRIPHRKAEKVAKLIPDDLGPEDWDNEALDDFKLAANSLGLLANWEYSLLNLCSVIYAEGMHPCGVLLSGEVISEHTPVKYRKEDNREITQWEYPVLEQMGFLKMDFLGLDTVDLIADTVRLCQQDATIPEQSYNMVKKVLEGCEDPATYNTFSKGDTFGVFQFANPSVAEICKAVKPSKLEELADITALYRPGPMGSNSHRKYAGIGAAELPSPEFKGTPVESIYQETKGVLIYQEQVMRIAQACGFTLQEADKLRKAMGKKKKDVMDKMQEKFITGGVDQLHVSTEAMESLWEVLVPFSSYGFNQCFHGSTRVVLPDDSSVTVQELFNHQEQHPGEIIEIKSLYPDGEFKPHQVKRIVKTGLKPLYRVETAAGRVIHLTAEHRMLTNFGYATIADGGLQVGTELLTEGGHFELSNEGSAARCDASTCRSLPVELDIEGYGEDWFKENKYSNGEPFLYVTPGSYRDTLDEYALTAVLNSPCQGLDKIVSITPPRLNKQGEPYCETTYDIEMEESGPANFIANGLVSHNSHAISYAVNSWQAAYLKTHFPKQFYSALLNIRRGEKEKFRRICEHLANAQFTVNFPSWRNPVLHCSPTPGERLGITLGLDCVAGLSKATAEKLAKEKPSSLVELISLVKGSKKDLLALEKAGYLDEMDGYVPGSAETHYKQWKKEVEQYEKKLAKQKERCLIPLPVPEPVLQMNEKPSTAKERFLAKFDTMSWADFNTSVQVPNYKLRQLNPMLVTGLTRKSANKKVIYEISVTANGVVKTYRVSNSLVQQWESWRIYRDAVKQWRESEGKSGKEADKWKATFKRLEAVPLPPPPVGTPLLLHTAPIYRWLKPGKLQDRDLQLVDYIPLALDDDLQVKGIRYATCQGSDNKAVYVKPLLTFEGVCLIGGEPYYNVLARGAFKIPVDKYKCRKALTRYPVDVIKLLECELPEWYTNDKDARDEVEKWVIQEVKNLYARNSE